MNTLTIKIKDSKALKLIQDLESLDLIQVISKKKQKPLEKLSAVMTGSITKEQADSMQKELKQMRSEWERDIY